MEMVRTLAWKFLGAVRPEDGSVRPVGPTSVVALGVPVGTAEAQGKTAAVADVELLQKGAPEGPPSPYP